MPGASLAGVFAWVRRGAAGAAEILLLVGVPVLVWWLALGWDWSVVPAGAPDTYRDPHTGLDWGLVYLAAVASVGWLAARGRAVLAPFAVALPLVALSGWRMAVAEVVGANLWPVGLAVVVVTLGLACAVAALLGAWARRRAAAQPPMTRDDPR